MEDKNTMQFAQRFKFLRKRAGLTQEEVSKKLGYSTHTSVFKIEAGLQEVPITQIPAICKALQCTPLELLGLKSEGDYLVSADPSSETLFERMQKLPAAQRNQLKKTIDLIITGMEEGNKNG